MNGLLRHMAVRLWATALCGAMACMVVLPFWQSILKVRWTAIPAGAMLILCFLILGWAMNRLGMAKIHRLLHEAGVWERAGDLDTAEGIFERTMALFDSFWLSLKGRRQAEEFITARLARFYLSQPSAVTRGQTMIKQYLSRHPHDTALARSWLEQMPANPHADPHDDMLAAHIGDILSDDPDIQLLLMQYYLAARRCDYDAVQTYRRVQSLRTDLPDADLHALARVLMNNNQINDWALQIYLKGYDSGDPYCLEGIAASARFLRPHPGNQQALAQARRITEALDAKWQEKAVQRFKPMAFGAEMDAQTSRPPAKPVGIPIDWRRRRDQAGHAGLKAAAYLLGAGRGFSRIMGRVVQGFGHISRPRLRWRYGLMISGFSLVAVIALMAGFRGAKQPPSLVEDSPVIEQKSLPLVEQPFTIQVAAYLNADDARRYVSQLQNQGLEAFSTEAVSAHRKWFQVKVSRFETKMQAREYGEKLKSSGLIDDFYVANYQQR